QQAEKLRASTGGFSFFSRKEDKLQDAVELYVRAANAFRLQKNYKEAGKTFELAAKINRNDLKELDDAADNMLQAFKVYRKDSPEDAVRCLQASIDQYTSKGNYRRAASHMENMGEVFENEIGDRKRALEAYEKAAEWYEDDNAPALANKLWLKVADIAALEGDYYKAISQYEKVADSSLSNNLMKYSVKEYYLKAGLCILATKDIVTARRNIDKYREKDPSFATQRECQFLVDLVEAVEAGEQEVFQERVAAYRRAGNFDQWKITLVNEIGSQIEEADNEFS
ncbi:putative vesicular-fusion protein sec17, partial [Apodospora peruviana]